MAVIIHTFRPSGFPQDLDQGSDKDMVTWWINGISNLHGWTIVERGRLWGVDAFLGKKNRDEGP